MRSLSLMRPGWRWMGNVDDKATLEVIKSTLTTSRRVVQTVVARESLCA